MRTTTYFDEALLAHAKKLAIDERKSLYEVLNEKLSEALGVVVARTQSTSLPQKFSLDKTFGPPFKLGLKNRHLTRADYYE